MNILLDELEQYRQEQGLSIKEIASKLGVPYKTAQCWFAKGKSHYDPSPDNQLKIKRLLHPETHPTLEVDSLTLPSHSESDTGEEKGDDTTTSPIAILRGKTIRDSIQVDIELKPLEIRVIDTPDFQRLRYIKQLGTAIYVFPGATHSRFEHSLGTVAAAQVMIDSINNNPENQLQIEPDIVKLIRMCALLHDITHIPFGHTLEDEGFLYSRHDEVNKSVRWDRFLGPSSDIGRRLIEGEGEEFRQNVVKYLTIPHNQVSTLEHPYVVDIFGNTICADLIDYLARDTTYAGLKETFDPRFLRSLLIASYETPGKPEESFKNRLVISLLKDNRVRRDIISEVMHLLRLRYSLAEKIYYHHAKIKTSAMVIEAVQAGLINRPADFSEMKLCEMKFGDNELLVRLKDIGGSISTNLINKLNARALYKPVYMLSYSAPSPEDTSWDEKVAIIKGFKEKPEKRFELERTLEKWSRLPEGSVLIYCPTEDMNLKQIETLCLWRDGQIKPLIKIPGEKLNIEAKNINDAHKELWKLYVLLDRDISRKQETMHHLASDCYHVFQLSNCIEELRTVDMHPLGRYIEDWAESRPDLNVTVAEKHQLVATRSLYNKRVTQTPPSPNGLEKDLGDIRMGGQ